MTPSPLPASSQVATRLPYQQATPAQRGLALADLMGELRHHFPTLELPAWCKRLEQARPDLLVYGDQEVYLDTEDVARLAQQLATEPGLPNLSPPIYCHEAYYLARRLVGFERQASKALAEIEANLTAYGDGVCALVFDLAAGNGIAHEVYRRTQRLDSRLPDPAASCHAVSARIEAVCVARGKHLSQLPLSDELSAATAT